MDSDTLRLLDAYKRSEAGNTPADNSLSENTPQKKSAQKTSNVWQAQELGQSGEEDSAIVKAFLKRDERAVSAAMEKYGKRCFSIANRFLQNAEDSNQCVNDAVLKVWESIPPNRPRELLPYLARIVKNLALNKLRMDNSIKRGGGAVSAVFEELSECVSGSASAEEALEAKELQAAIDKFLETLKPLHRKMFLLRYWLCCEPDEIAERLGTTKGSVAVTLTAVRKKLKAYLQRRGYDL